MRCVVLNVIAAFSHATVIKGGLIDVKGLRQGAPMYSRPRGM
jgi:hypothetical protein